VFSLIDLGIEKGFFQKQGLDIELLTLAGGAKIAQAMVAGSIDIGFGSGPRFRLPSRAARPKKASRRSPAPCSTSRSRCATTAAYPRPPI